MDKPEGSVNEVEQGTVEESADKQGNEQQGDTGHDNAGESEKRGDAKYTDEDVDSIVTKRLERERAKIEREVRNSIAKEQDDKRTEAEKLSNMTELQKAQYEARKLKEEKEALEAERDLSQQMTIARRELSDSGIHFPDELLSMFVSKEAEKTGEAIDKIKTLWPKALNDAVQEKLKRQTPPAEQQPGKKSFGASYAESYSKQKNGGKN